MWYCASLGGKITWLELGVSPMGDLYALILSTTKCPNNLWAGSIYLLKKWPNPLNSIDLSELLIKMRAINFRYKMGKKLTRHSM